MRKFSTTGFFITLLCLGGIFYLLPATDFHYAFLHKGVNIGITISFATRCFVNIFLTDKSEGNISSFPICSIISVNVNLDETSSIKALAYGSQGGHNGQLDLLNSLVNDSTTG